MAKELGAARTVNIHIPGAVSNDLDKLQDITRQVLGRLGCEGCHSGFDIRFKHVLDYVVNPRTLEVEDALQGGIR
ncbi:MAG: hypothetical protein QOE31_3902 [Solirubrobacteraceae bacterium]|jgi:hypothetical protein|nr:hypothetical protein [Solirubrobacteraceae bacterium]